MYQVWVLFLRLSPDPSFLNDDSTDRKWYSESPLEWYPKTIPSRDVFPDSNMHSATRKQPSVRGGPHDLGKLSNFDPENESALCQF